MTDKTKDLILVTACVAVFFAGFIIAMIVVP